MQVQFLPEDFAWYIALSAFFRRVPVSSPGSAWAIPSDMVTGGRTLPSVVITFVSLIVFLTLSATIQANSMGTPARSIMNSSPPYLAQRSVGRRLSTAILATAERTSSPASCP